MKENNTITLLDDYKVSSNLIQINSNNSEEILRIEYNGDIFYRSRLIKNDKEIADGLREFLTEQGYIRPNNIQLSKELNEQNLDDLPHLDEQGNLK